MPANQACRPGLLCPLCARDSIRRAKTVQGPMPTLRAALLSRPTASESRRANQISGALAVARGRPDAANLSTVEWLACRAPWSGGQNDLARRRVMTPDAEVALQPGGHSYIVWEETSCRIVKAAAYAEQCVTC